MKELFILANLACVLFLSCIIQFKEDQLEVEHNKRIEIEQRMNRLDYILDNYKCEGDWGDPIQKIR